TPAPKKPIPVTIFAAIRSSEILPIRELKVKMVEPKQIRMIVRKPADLFLNSRSNPTTAPHAIEINILCIGRSANHCAICGNLIKNSVSSNIYHRSGKYDQPLLQRCLQNGKA